MLVNTEPISRTRAATGQCRREFPRCGRRYDREVEGQVAGRKQIQQRPKRGIRPSNVIIAEEKANGRSGAAKLAAQLSKSIPGTGHTQSTGLPAGRRHG